MYGEPRVASRMTGRSLLLPEDWDRLSAALQLSPREAQIVQGVFDDEKEQTIAWGLGISGNTVNTYFRRLYRKLQVSSRPQLILRVLAEYLAILDSGSHALDSARPQTHLTHEGATWHSSAEGA